MEEPLHVQQVHTILILHRLVQQLVSHVLQDHTLQLELQVVRAVLAIITV